MSEENLKDEISLVELVEKGKDWFYFLVTKWTIIFASIILGATIGLIYSCFKKPIYTATLTFALEDDGSGGGLSSAMGLASQFGFDIGGNGGGAFEDSNLLELFKSHKIVVQTLLNPVDFKNKRISLAELYIQDCGWREKWNNDPNLKSLKFLPKSNRENLTRKHDSILGLIYQDLYTNSLSVTKKDKKIDITSIEVISINEFFAKSFAESLVKEVSDFYIETKSKKARINMDILKKQTDSVRNALNYSITGVAIANDNNFNLNPALNIKRTPSVRKQVDVQANTAILTELVKQTEFAKVALRKETPLFQIIDEPIYPLKKLKFGKIKGIVLGGFISGFLVLLYLIIKRIGLTYISKG